MMNKLALCVFCLLSLTSFGQEVIVLSDSKKDYKPEGSYYELILDKEGVLSSSQVLEDSIQQQFRGSGTGYDYEQIDATYWTRFSVLANGKPTYWLVELVDPHIQTIDFYELKDGKLEQLSSKNGFIHPFKNKTFEHKNYIYSVDLSDRKIHHYYFRIDSEIVNFKGIKIRSAEYLIGYSLFEYFLLGLFYGILLIMAVYNLFIFFSVREKVYIFYVLYVIACGFNSLNEDGLGFQYIWPNAPWFNMVILRFSPVFLLLVFTMYSNSFLKLRKEYFRLFVISYLLVGLNIILFAINGLGYNFELDFQVIYLLSFAFIYVSAIYSVIKGNRPARYFLLGYSFILLSIVVFYLRTKGIDLFGHIFAVYSFNYGFILEVVILSYALSERLKEEKQDKENAQQIIIAELKEKERLKDSLNRELEQKVDERTLELQMANEKIGRINKFLADRNIKLQEDVKQISKERIMQKTVSFDEFKLTYPNEEACFQFLSELKWSKGYQCRKCGNDKFLVLTNYVRRCNKCKYIESSTAFTIFHSLKFSILDAFYLLFLVSTKSDITAEELSRTIQLSEKSCANFKKKIASAEKALKGKSKDKSGWERLIPTYEPE